MSLLISQCSTINDQNTCTTAFCANMYMYTYTYMYMNLYVSLEAVVYSAVSYTYMSAIQVLKPHVFSLCFPLQRDTLLERGQLRLAQNSALHQQHNEEIALGIALGPVSEKHRLAAVTPNDLYMYGCGWWVSAQPPQRQCLYRVWAFISDAWLGHCWSLWWSQEGRALWNKMSVYGYHTMLLVSRCVPCSPVMYVCGFPFKSLIYLH